MPLRELVIAGAQLAVLSAFALAQPLFDLLGKNAEFFAARGSSSRDIVVFAVALTFVPPAVLLLLEVLAGLVDARLRRGLHLVFVGVLAAVIALQLLQRVTEDPALALVAAAAALGVAAAAAFARVSAIRTFVNVLSPAPLVFLGLFLFQSPVSKLVFPEEQEVRAAPVTASAPVVMVVFDELPAVSLLGADRRIDAGRFPNFARLARSSTWFRNTTSVTGLTTQAVPTILTGRYPEDGKLPVFSEQPDNLFTLLGGSYDIEAVESVTRMCPTDLCERVAEPAADRAESLVSDLSVVYLHVLLPEDLATHLPSVSDNWMGFLGDDEGGREPEPPPPPPTAEGRDPARRARPAADRDVLVEDFIASIRAKPDPTLHFLHVLLPHRPWTYLPSGKDYGNTDVRVYGQTPAGFWTHDDVLLDQAYQRYLLQLGFADRLLGKLLRRLEATGLDRTALLVVAADHGLSFAAGDAPRGVRASNLHELGPVPLFIRRPGQRRARVVERNVQTIDVLPGIADALGIRVPWKTDGRSAFDPALDRRELPFTGGFVLDAAELEERRYAMLDERVSEFGSGEDPLRLYRVGTNAELVGRAVDPLRNPAARGAGAALDHPEWYRSVDLSSTFLPAFVTGTLEGLGPGVDLAIGVNGRVAGVTRSFDHRGETRFAGMVTESAFRAGANEIELFAVFPGEPPRLDPIDLSR